WYWLSYHQRNGVRSVQPCLCKSTNLSCLYLSDVADDMERELMQRNFHPRRKPAFSRINLAQGDKNSCISVDSCPAVRTRSYWHLRNSATGWSGIRPAIRKTGQVGGMVQRSKDSRDTREEAGGGGLVAWACSGVSPPPCTEEDPYQAC